MMTKFYVLFAFCFSLLFFGNTSFAVDSVHEPGVSLEQVQLPEEQNTASAPEADPYRFYTAFFGMLSTLGIIVVMIIAITWFLKKILMTRQNQMNQTSFIKIIESRAITSKTMLHLVQVYDKKVLFVDSHHGVVKIADLDSETQSQELSC